MLELPPRNVIADHKIISTGHEDIIFADEGSEVILRFRISHVDCNCE